MGFNLAFKGLIKWTRECTVQRYRKPSCGTNTRTYPRPISFSQFLQIAPITKATEHTPSWEDSGCSAAQDILYTLQGPKIHSCTQNRPGICPLIFVLFMQQLYRRLRTSSAEW